MPDASSIRADDVLVNCKVAARWLRHAVAMHLSAHEACSAGSTPLNVTWLASPTASMFSRTRRRWTSSGRTLLFAVGIYPLLAGSIGQQDVVSVKAHVRSPKILQRSREEPHAVSSRIVNAI